MTNACIGLFIKIKDYHAIKQVRDSRESEFDSWMK